MIVLSKDQILGLHRELTDTFKTQATLLNEGLLEQSVKNPFQEGFGLSMYPTCEEKCARLGYGLISNHAFSDGNKRIGAHAMLVQLALNGILLHYTQEELYSVIYAVADGAKGYEDLLNWVKSHRIFTLS